MDSEVVRLGFLQKAVAGSFLAILGFLGPTSVASPLEFAADSQAAMPPRIVVIVQDVSRDVDPRASSWGYVTEVFQRAGLFFEQLSPSQLPSLRRPTNPIILLAGNLQLTPAERDAVVQLVKDGGSVIGVGGTSGLDNVFGVNETRSLAEGWIRVTAQDHPVTAGLRSSLHVFGGHAVTASTATVLAEIETNSRVAKGSAILENRFGKGHAILLSPDLLFSIVHIQQGVPVFQDGAPAADGSASLNDGELKAEDGFVLDWQRDRTPMEPDGKLAFLEPITDELREILLRSVFYVANQQGSTLPMLWYWPRGMKAIGHISHDSDGNDPEKAAALLEVMNRCNVKSTWCMLYPGGYPREFYDVLKQQGFEIALHYDARTGGAKRSWSKENFIFQHNWLLKEAGLDQITSNKNHYTRWESRLDFLRWCEEVGIKSDQTRGPSKKGTIGFPLGGSQPYFALDDEAPSPRILDVLQVNMLTQDLVVVCPAEYGRQLVDSVLRHHGVAHFLFHPAHIQKPNVAEALCQLVEYGRANELEWWTSQQIYRWEVQRRNVAATFGSGNTLILHAPEPVREATLLFLKSRSEARQVTVNDRPAQCEPWNVYGFEFDAVTLDVVDEVKVTVK